MRKQNLLHFCILITLLVTLLIYGKSSIASLPELGETDRPRGIPENKFSRAGVKNFNNSPSSRPTLQSEEQDLGFDRTIYVKKLLSLTIIKPCQKIDYKIFHERQERDIDPGFLIDENRFFELGKEIDGCILLSTKYE